MGRRSKKRNRDRQNKLNQMFNEDEEMAMIDLNEGRKKDAKELSKLNKKERKKKLRQMMQNSNRREKDVVNNVKWYKIWIKGEAPLEREFVLSSISNIIDMEFNPLGFSRIDNSCCFYLENNEPAATAIEGLDRRLQGPDGCRLKIVSRKCEAPDLILNADQLQVMRQCLSGRYSTDTCLLDLTHLHNDPMLTEKDILTPLQTPCIMKQVLRLVKDNIPELKALSLSKNNLQRTDFSALQSLQSGSSQLAALNLEHNNICDLKVLNMIKMFPLTELNMQFNPIVDKYKEKPIVYIKEVRSRIGSLKLLDNIDINRYLAENDKPVPRKININFSKNEKIMCSSSSNSEFEVSDATIRVFLDQYYGLIETPERSNLVAAYTPDAVLDLKSNLMMLNSNVLVGHDKIREALAGFPAIKHDHSTFSLSTHPISPKETKAELTGICQVAGLNTPVAFHRIMVIVPFNTGFCCSQDKLEFRILGT